MPTTVTAQRDQTIWPDDVRFALPGARAVLLAWCKANGVDGDTVGKITVTGRRVEFMRYLVNAAGKRYVDGTGVNAATDLVVVDEATVLPEVWW